MSTPMQPSIDGDDVRVVEEEDEVQIVEKGARQQAGPHGVRTPEENLCILLAQKKKAGKSSWWKWLEPVLVQKQGDEYPLLP